MSESRRMTSIARRINLGAAGRILGIFILIDIIAAGLLCASFCYQEERQALGPKWTPFLSRSFDVTRRPGVSQTLSTVRYSFRAEDGDARTVAAGNFLQTIYRAALPLFAVEMLVLAGQLHAGRRQTERMLLPLRRMTASAEQLSRAALDAKKYHDLESAIDAISPATPDAKLETGDRDLKGLENAVNNLLVRMHESYREQVRFVSDASHELRTPIAVIQGYADMLARWGSNDPKVLSESIQAIRSESKNMQELVEQLLFLARGDAGRTRLKPVRLDLSEMMRELYEEYEMIVPDRRWTVQADSPVAFEGDAALIKQAARILADNAVKYSDENDAVTLRAFKTPEGLPAFSVQDDGAGISSKDMPHIFERFYRADPARARQSGGTGLGLSIAKWIVDSHEGYFNVVSREGLGTRVEVILPAPKPAAEQGKPEIGAAEGGAMGARGK